MKYTVHLNSYTCTYIFFNHENDSLYIPKSIYTDNMICTDNMLYIIAK